MRLLVFRITCVLLTLLAAVSTPAAAAQDGLPVRGNRDLSLVAATPGYRFYSDFWVNLHTYLYGITGGGPDERAGFEEENPECIAHLDPALAEPWHEAVAFYRANLGGLWHRGGTMREIRYRLTTLGEYTGRDSIADAAIVQLERAAPAYHECLWSMHDVRNREAIGGLLAKAVVYAPSAQERLSAYYHAGWPEGVSVDVAAYTDFAGANTESGPGLADHMMLASAALETRGFSGLELLLHEASHIVFGPRHGAVSRVLSDAAASLDLPVPRDLWHAISFFTSGMVVEEAAAAAGARYTAYRVRRDVYPQFDAVLEEHWKPYLDGEIDLDEAARRTIAASARM